MKETMLLATFTTKTYADLATERGDIIEVGFESFNGAPAPEEIELMVRSCLSGLPSADSGLILAGLDGKLEEARAKGPIQMWRLRPTLGSRITASSRADARWAWRWTRDPSISPAIFWRREPLR